MKGKRRTGSASELHELVRDSLVRTTHDGHDLRRHPYMRKRENVVSERKREKEEKTVPESL
jgi:hypothetical protein